MFQSVEAIMNRKIDESMMFDEISIYALACSIESVADA
jgi:hypothetical protein